MLKLYNVLHEHGFESVFLFLFFLVQKTHKLSHADRVIFSIYIQQRHPLVISYRHHLTSSTKGHTYTPYTPIQYSKLCP